jgi:hypothetical protein
MRPFTPAVALMNRLTYPGKFAVIGVLFLIPLTLISVFLTRELNERIQFAQSELQGNELLKPLRRLAEIEQLQRHAAFQSTARPVDGEVPVSPQADGIEQALRDMDAADQRFGQSLGVRQDWQLLRKKMTSTALPKEVSPAARFDVSTKRSTEIIGLMNQVGDRSNLILDPDLDTYYLMDAVVNRLPLLAEETNRVMCLIHDETDWKVSREYRAYELSSLAGSIADRQRGLQRNLEVAFRETKDRGLEKRMAAVVKKS